MIHYLYGENSFEIERALKQLVADSNEAPEKIDGAAVERRDVPDIFAGQTLFALQRLIVIRGLADNKSVWSELENYLDKISTDTTIILIDAKPDKRTRTFKTLQKMGEVREYKLKNERELKTWVVTFAADEFEMKLGRAEADLLVTRVGTDQWALYHALEKLSVLDAVTPEAITEIIEASPHENVFLLLESALGGNQAKVSQIISVLEANEDGFRTFGLLTSQVLSLTALSLAGPNDNVAKDFGTSPFALQKLRPYAAKLTPARRRRIVDIFADADSELKLGAEPWLVIAKSLAKL